MDKPGRYDNMSFAEYLADPAPVPSLSRSAIVDILDSPLRCWWNHPKLNPHCPPEKEKTQFDIGSAAHDLLLKGGDAVAVIEGFNDYRKDAAKEARDDARKAGKTPLLRNQYEEVLGMVTAAKKAIAECPDLPMCDLSDGAAEVTYCWREGETWIKIRVDWIRAHKNLILDYKTTGVSAHPEAFGRIAISSGLDIQESLYRRGVKAVEGVDADFIFMAQEVEPPYLCSFFRLDAMTLDMGDQKVERGLELWRKCLSTGEWPGYPPTIQTLEAPPWAMAAWEQKQFSIGISLQGEL